MSTSVIIVAGGVGRRFSDDIPKQYHKIKGRSILEITCDCFLKHPQITNIIMVCNKGYRSYYQDIIDNNQQIMAVDSGNTRQESVYNGLKHLAPLHPDNVLITDAVRPLITQELINKLLDELKVSPAVIPVSKIPDTLFSIETNNIIDREKVRVIQTPQAFKFALIWDLHQKHQGAEFSDDSSLCIKEGIKIKMVENSIPNIKITTRDDLKIVKYLLG